MAPDVVIAHLSDLHLGAHHGQAIDSVVDDVATATPTVTVISGDLTMRATAAQFEAARAFLARLPQPQVLVLGNHDIPLYDALERFGSPYDRYREGIHSTLDPVVDAPDVRVLGLASMPRWRWKSGRVSDRQAGLVERHLGDAPAAALRVLALHHPPFASGAERIRGKTGLRRAIVAAGVDVVLAGHTHVPTCRQVQVADGDDPAVVRPVVEVVAGTATSERTRGTPRAWALVTATSRTITVTHRVHRGTEWVEDARVEFPRVPHPPRQRVPAR